MSLPFKGCAPKVLPNILSKGPSIKYVTLFLANFDPPCHTLSHIPGPPESTSHISDPPFSRPSTKILDKSPLYKVYLNCSRRFLPGGILSGLVFVRSPFYHNKSVTTYNRKLNITLNSMFHRYGKKLV